MNQNPSDPLVLSPFLGQITSEQTTTLWQAGLQWSVLTGWPSIPVGLPLPVKNPTENNEKSAN
jgi:hypothetical protein